MDYVSNDAPDFEGGVFIDGLGWVVFVFRQKRKFFALDADALDSQFAVHVGDHYVFVFWFQRAVHDQDIAGMDTGLNHGIAPDSYEVGGGGVPDQVFVQVELAFDIVVGRRGEPGRNAGHKERASARGGGVRSINCCDFGFFHACIILLRTTLAKDISS